MTMELPSEDVGDWFDNMHTDIDEDVIAKVQENLVSQSGLISEPVAAALGKLTVSVKWVWHARPRLHS